jgi:xylulokinase
MLTTVAAMLGVDAAEFSRLALSAPSGADGLVWVPYFAGERSPNLPNASGALHGATTGNLTPANVARAAVEGLLASITYCMQKTTDQGIPAEQVQLLGGAARSEAVRSIAPAILGRPVLVPNPAEFVALGAARQAAWVLTQDDDPPAWPSVGFADYRAMPTPWIVERYNEARLLILDRQP